MEQTRMTFKCGNCWEKNGKWVISFNRCSCSCPTCKSSINSGLVETTCFTCGGSGKAVCSKCKGKGTWFLSLGHCKACSGQGRINCQKCRSGKVLVMCAKCQGTAADPNCDRCKGSGCRICSGTRYLSLEETLPKLGLSSTGYTSESESLGEGDYELFPVFSLEQVSRRLGTLTTRSAGANIIMDRYTGREFFEVGAEGVCYNVYRIGEGQYGILENRNYGSSGSSHALRP